MTFSIGTPDPKWTFSEHELIKDVALAWGWKMICNGKLEWEDGQHV